MVWRIIGTVLGLGLFIVSFPLMISPLPLGLLLMFMAVIMLVASNPLAARLLRLLRRRWDWIDRFFGKAQELLPPGLAAPLEDTHAEQDEKEHAPSGPDGGADASSRLGPPMRRIDIPRRLR